MNPTALDYSFQRLVLLGSAGYQRAELPLDDSVSLIAPNNTGKTSLINALQFLLIIHQKRMDFGAHEFDKTRRFYFPNASAYILLEVSLPQAGMVVLGCVGKGVSHDYEYFAYQGPLHIDDYKMLDGSLVSQPQLVGHMAEKGRSVYRYNASDFRDLVYGGRKVSTANSPDFTIFKLEHAPDAQAFQQVLTRTLRLDKLNSKDVKNYLLQIFRRDLPHANIDFKQEWDKAFFEVNSERAQYQAALTQLENIENMQHSFEERLQLRGKLIDWRIRVDAGLQLWQAHYQSECNRYLQHEKQLKDQQSENVAKDRTLIIQQEEGKNSQAQLKAQQQEQNALTVRFALVDRRELLDSQLKHAKQELDQQTSTLLQVKALSLGSILRDKEDVEKKLKQLFQQRDSCGDDLYRHLSKVLNPEQLQSVNKVLSNQVMTLPASEFILDIDALKRALTGSSEKILPLIGLQLSLKTLQPQHQQLSEQQLNERIEDSERKLRLLKEQYQVAKELSEGEKLKQQLETKWRELEHDLRDFDHLQTLQKNENERQEQLKTLHLTLENISNQLINSQRYVDQLINEIEEVRHMSRELDEQHKQIDNIRNQRIDSHEAFVNLVNLNYQPWVGQTDWPLAKLAGKLKEYQGDCRRLQELDKTLKQLGNELHAAGLTKYQYNVDLDTELQLIINFSQQLPKEQLALEKKARSAVINVTNSLRELRDGLFAFQGKMREFNRFIGRRQLSDLKTFKIEACDEESLVEAIDTMISTATQVESGDSFELFNQTSVLDDRQLERAKQVLINEGNARGGLKVADLFRLEFVVAKVGQKPESFRDIDSAASNGTVLMAKLVTGLAMLHLMQDQRHKVRAICYLDEALALDVRNQRNLIEIAGELGFSLIFASPAPLTTARYCVPIQRVNGKNHISRKSWQLLQPLDQVAL